jgi:peptidoglycan/LPS O-acetylase OafA/YrhL
MSLPWITLIGGACYSIYLTHVPVMQALYAILFRVARPESLAGAWSIGPALLIPPTIAVGLIFYLMIERPCMDANWPTKLGAWLGRRFGRRTESDDKGRLVED